MGSSHPDVFAVNGYSYPVSYSYSEGSNVIKQYATVSEWGIGYWKKKYLKALRRVEKGFLRKISVTLIVREFLKVWSRVVDMTI